MKQTANIEDIDEYQKAWTSTMMKIWEEKLMLLEVRDTGSLMSSIKGGLKTDLIEFKFLEYGLYQDTGVGYLYKGHEGNIPFLDEAYREEHGLDVPKKTGPAWGSRWTSGHPRKAKPWFNKKFWASTMKLKDDMARIIGEEFIGIVQNISK